MGRTIVYIHGKGGNAQESEHYRKLFPEDHVIGFNYKSQTPWEALDEFPELFVRLGKKSDSLVIIANSIGAFFAINALSDVRIEKAFFISPIVNMEKLIADMMRRACVTEQDLMEKGTIETNFGETLSIEYLTFIRTHPVSWRVPTSILYGSNDNLQSLETVKAFADKYNADLTIMENGEHWFHSEEQMEFLDKWICGDKI